MKRYILTVLAALMLAAAMTSCNKPQADDYFSIDKFVGTFSYTETRTLKYGKETTVEVKTGTLTITNPYGNELHITAPLATDAMFKSGGAQFQANSVTVKDDDTDMTFQFSPGYMDRDGVTLHFGYTGVGSVKVNGKKTSATMSAEIEGIKR